MLQILGRHLPGEPQPVHGEHVSPQVLVVEVEDENKHDGKERFVAVHHKEHVPDPRERPCRKEGRHGHREREEEPRCADDEHAPVHRPVVELLHVVELPELRLLLRDADEVADVLDEVYNVLRHGDEGKSHLPLAHLVDQIKLMVDEVENHRDPGHPMDDPGGLRASPYLDPRARRLDIGVLEPPAGEGQEQERREHDDVLDSR